MFTSTSSGFRKSEDCPPSHELLEFQNGDLPRSRGNEVRSHLVSCDFCSAEVDFYSHYPQAEGTAEAAEIPAPLFELAEALLKNRTSDPASLDSLIGACTHDKV